MELLPMLCLTVLSVLTTNAQMLNEGRCPVPPVQQDFNVARYAGRWHSIERTPASFGKGDCTQATYTLRPDGQVAVLNQALRPNGVVASIEGTARVADTSDPAKLEVSFPMTKTAGPYWVLSTDYESFTLVYSCTNQENQTYKYNVWIMSRERSLQEETIETLRGILTFQGINIDQMYRTDQSNCDAMP